MSTDAEKLLKYIVDKSKTSNDTEVDISISEIKDIPNISIAIDKLLNELAEMKFIIEYKKNTIGEIYAYLTTDGQEYFNKKKKENLKNNNVLNINMSGGQFNYANDNSTINAIQNNGISTNELDNIIKAIKENLGGLEKEEAEEIIDVVDMTKEELVKPRPKVSRLKNCLTLITPMLSIANGIPTLSNNLQKLVDYITLHIR